MPFLWALSPFYISILFVLFPVFYLNIFRLPFIWSVFECMPLCNFFSSDLGINLGFPSSSLVKNLLMQEIVGSISGLARFPWEGNGNSLQFSCLGNPRDRGAWCTTVHGITESDMTEWLNHKDHIVCLGIVGCILWTLPLIISAM